jgi:DNA helicase-2/ATP-dependent DNA helicase PcrA
VLAAHYPWCAEWQADLDRLFAPTPRPSRRSVCWTTTTCCCTGTLALQEAPVAQAMGARFDHVLVDEFQDTNRLQAGILHALKPDGRGVTVVGDDAQAIYGFRAAEVGNMLGFPATFHATGMRC